MKVSIFYVWREYLLEYLRGCETQVTLGLEEHPCH